MSNSKTNDAAKATIYLFPRIFTCRVVYEIPFGVHNVSYVHGSHSIVFEKLEDNI